MTSLSSGINVALQALLSNQHAISVIEHNVANANTEGYHRQDAVFAAGIPYPSPRLQGGTSPGQMGSGVLVERIRRFNMEFFDGRYRREMAETNRWETEEGVLQQVEATLSETSDDGVIPKLDAFWQGWRALSDDPTNQALRADLREKAVALSDGLNWRAQSLMTLRKDQNLAIIQRVEEINDAALQVAKLNAEISKVQAAGDAPNDLLDSRDAILDRLSEISGAIANTQENGEVIVYVGQHALVVGSTTFKLQTTVDNANNGLAQITWEQDGLPLDTTRGELAGLLDARDRVIPDQLDALNNLAYNLATQVNNLHSTGYGLNNATGLDFFTPFTSPNYALEISVSSDLDDLNNIAASTTTDSPGNGNLAVQLADLREATVMNGNTTTLNAYYTGKVGELGLEVSNAGRRAEDRKTVADSLNTLRESASGVSLDEEAANLVKYQRAYQAATRLLTAFDEMMDRVINGMGLVGL